MSFRDNLKQELLLGGILVKELAASTGIQKRALDTYLLNENASIPPADTAVKIAHALGVSVESLVTGEETALPIEIRQTVRNLLMLDKKDRRVVAILIKTLLDNQGTKGLSLNN